LIGACIGAIGARFAAITGAAHGAAAVAGSAADGFALLERFETKLKDFPNNVPRAATELAKLWRTDRMLRRLEAVLACRDAIDQNVKPRIAVEAMMLSLWKG